MISKQDNLKVINDNSKMVNDKSRNESETFFSDSNGKRCKKIFYLLTCKTTKN